MSKITLNEDQQSALETLKTFVKGDKKDSSSKHMFLLEGAAGTGKTTTVTEFMSWIHSNNIFGKVCMSSPTHKALKVMMEMCPQELKGMVTFSTLHSMLGLKHEITKDGDEIFVKDKKVMSKYPFYDFVIVDESSMIADQLFNEMEEQNYRKNKVLFVGDGNQINPVNHETSIPMNPMKRIQFNIGHARLNKIVRQAETNPIIALSQKVINNTFEFSSGYKDMVDDTGVVMISESQKTVVQQLLTHYFKSEDFDNNANFCKIIAWRNLTVDFYNKYVRSFKYGSKCSKIVLNEKLLVDKPIVDEKLVIFNTNEDLIVNRFEVKTKKIFGTVWSYYDCEVSGMENTASIHILHEDDQKNYKTHMDAMKKSAISEKDSSKRLSKWREYYSFADNFAQVKYNYAITAHSSQGSTYDNCFVCNSDISINRNEEESRRILYTAFTRPRKMLYIL